MSIPYERQLAFDVVSGQDTCLELPAPPRGTINTFLVKQKDGALEGFEFDLYSKKAACPGESEDPECIDDPLLDSFVYRILPTQQAGNGVDSEELFDKNFAYENRDWDCQRRRSTTIYMRLKPAGTGTKTFHIGYAITGAPL